MMRFLLCLIALIALVWFAAAQLPLGFVLRKMPLNAMGVEWTQSEGTVWNGRIMGVYLNGQPVGDVDVALKPLSLLTLDPSMDLQWGGAGGRGAGTVTVLGSDSVEVSDVRLQQSISSLESLSPDLRAIGGTFRVSQAHILIEGQSCETASGELQTDTLALAAQRFGRQFSNLTGTLSCEDGAFDLNMSGASEAGDSLVIDGQATLQGSAAINVSANTRDSDIEALLANAGFSREGDSWVYRRTAEPAGSIQQ